MFEVLLLAVPVVAVAACLVYVSQWRRRPVASASDATRRDLGRLIDELKVAVRDQVDRLDREVRRLQDAIADAERARVALEEARTRATPAPAPSSPKSGNPLHARVFELRDSGKDPADIGVETGLEVGEVELILGLRRMPPRA